MRPDRPVRTIWIVAGLLLGFAVVLAGPVLFFQDFLQSSDWNEGNLKAEVQSVRYESGSLVFRYTGRNLTGHPAQFRPTLTEVHALQPKDHPSVGYPNVLLPFSVPSRGSHTLEVRLQLPAFPQLSSGVSPEPASAPLPSAEDVGLQDALTELEGFELVDETDGIRLVLPRAW
jgi:hypothetical protein